MDPQPGNLPLCHNWPCRIFYRRGVAISGHSLPTSTLKPLELTYGPWKTTFSVHALRGSSTGEELQSGQQQTYKRTLSCLCMCVSGSTTCPDLCCIENTPCWTCNCPWLCKVTIHWFEQLFIYLSFLLCPLIHSLNPERKSVAFQRDLLVWKTEKTH